MIIENIMVFEFDSNIGFNHWLESNPSLSASTYSTSGEVVEGIGGTMFLFDTNRTPASKSYGVGAKDQWPEQGF